jgi:hypothetical protein
LRRRPSLSGRRLVVVAVRREAVFAQPPRLPVPADSVVGRVLAVPAGKCRYRDDAFSLRVSKIRDDVSLWYGGDWVWLEGEDLGEQDCRRRFAPVLVHVSVLAHG